MNGSGHSPMKAFLLEVSGISSFMGRFFRNAFHRRFEWREFVRQCVLNGNGSFALVAITAFIMGLVLTVQSRPTLARFGAESMLPAMVAVSVATASRKMIVSPASRMLRAISFGSEPKGSRLAPLLQ